ncbi:MAG: PIG-L deacetylase family protein, partial [Candidatus Thorarchaeota archaeon]
MPQRILVLAPHTDDGELSMGGSIVKFLEEKEEVYIIAFSCAKASLNPKLPNDTLIKEIKEAIKVLGVP